MNINKVTVLHSDQGEFLYLITDLPQATWPFYKTGQQLSIQCSEGTSLEYFETHFKQFATPDCEFHEIDVRRDTCNE